ncbi:hypothetical protein CDAR_261091 [Caerostris darwini]|uniref:Decapping nuclease n=1 Tax=Caerostris darwini TaxID=1538125 RepID=A0AAV4Q772_9ARAC|nr:hypothetical protein CDAR_261091 [Caerostris darwini]
MASTWDSGLTFQPHSSNSEIFNNRDNNSSFTFIDFLPECQEVGGIFSKPQFESFRTLIDRANNWLRDNPKWKIVTCESVELRTRREIVNVEKMVYMERTDFLMCYIRGLRLWITEGDGSYKTKQIGYLNVIPQHENATGIFSSPVFESLDDVVSRFNKMMRTQPIPGRILTIESQEMKMNTSFEFDPDRSYWVERGDFQKRFLYIFRIFFVMGDSIPEEIGIADFIPDVIERGGFLSLPVYENFCNVIEKASNWCTRQTGIRICTVQALEMKIKRDHDVYTQKMDFTEHGNRGTFYVKVLRVAYTRDLSNSPTHMTRLTCRTFVPLPLTRSVFLPKYESLSQTKERVSAWVKATGVEVLSAQTSALRLWGVGGVSSVIEGSFTYNRAERDEYWIFVIRLFINGNYHEPPPEMLPPVPDVEDTKCCVIL